MIDNKRIAKNTLFLYVRMIIIMAVTFYTSRVVLEKLGVDDFALYNVVGGVVGMLGFLNGTLSTGTSRFLAYELGANNIGKLNRTFNTTFYTHLILSLIILFILETAGLWFLHSKLVIPAERIFAAEMTFHISILTAIVSITQVPYTAVIMAHERMGVYGYVSIFEAVGRLSVVFMLSMADVDKLIFYAALIAVVQILVAMYYRYYCRKHFAETKLSLTFDKSILRELLGFTGWNVIANLTETIKLQGYVILINMFFQPFFVAAQAIANQISNALMQFVGNFRAAINPQIIKSYAAKEYDASKKLTLQTTVYVFDLVLLLGLPSILVMEQLLGIWLVDVPPYAVLFAQWVIAQNILSTFSTSFYIPMMAAGKLKKNAIASIFLGPGMFALLYIIYKVGGDVMWVQYILVFSTIAYGFIVKPYILVRDVQYKYADFIPCYVACLKVALLSIVLSLTLYAVCPPDSRLHAAMLFGGSFLSVILSAYIFLDAQAKAFIKKKLKRK